MDRVTLTDDERARLLHGLRLSGDPLTNISGVVENLITERLDAQSRADFLASMPPKDDGYHHWHTRAGFKTMPSCGVCDPN